MDADSGPGAAARRAVAGTPFRVFTPETEPLPVASSLTVKAVKAEVPFKSETLVTREGIRVDERRETCWMAEDGVGGLAYRCVLCI